MANTVNLDAMIPRADFCESDTDAAQSQKIQSLGLSQLEHGSFLVPSLRKPDFQRETNQWTIDQVVTFLNSFLENELVPSVILWKSPGKIFVIDGAHRLSVLIAWIRDDYGDRSCSKQFYSGNIPKQQLSIAENLRKRIGSEIGSFGQVRHAMVDMASVGSDVVLARRANNAVTRTLSLQWVEGDAEKAESSFFKINKQGTPLNKIEERLLRNRRKPLAIGARSILRAGSGHKYWSQFDKERQRKIENLSRNLHQLMFSPEIEFPIKTLNLPHGGSASPISAYGNLMDIFGYVVEGTNEERDGSDLYCDDDTGEKTIAALRKVLQVLSRMIGNNPSSLGLHPAVFFYSSTGRYWDSIFLAMIKVFAKAVRNNDDDFFKKFTDNRRTLETLFLENKGLIGQANIAMHSTKRVQRWSDLIEDVARGKLFKSQIIQDGVLEKLELSGKIGSSEIREISVSFSTRTKSAVFLRQSVDSAQRCPICKGLILVEKSVSYDHIRPKSSGGKGNVENAQLTHPYCNSIKN